MKNILVYTFRTFPYISELEDIFGKIFVLGKLKKGLEILGNKIKSEKTDLVLGIAKSTKAFSTFEPTAINKFNQNGKVSANGKVSYPLFVPDLKNTPFKISDQPTTSFCNYSAYKTAKFINTHDIPTKLSFVHILKKDIPRLLHLFYV